MPLNSADNLSDQQSTSNYFPQQNSIMTNVIGFDPSSGQNLFQPFQEMPKKSNSFNNICHASFANPLFYNLAVQPQRTQFGHASTMAEIMRSPESIQLINTLLQQPILPTTPSTFLNSSYNKTSTLLMEQQAREAEAHRIQFLNFQALHNNSATSSLIPQNNIIQMAEVPCSSNGEVEMVEKVPVLGEESTSSREKNDTTLLSGTSKSVFDGVNQIFGVLPQTPYYPTHFMRGTVLQTANDSKKRVEALNVEDFANVSDIASLAHEMNLCVGVVVNLKQTDPSARQSTVYFETERQLENGDLEISTCELDTPVEYPFFELSKKWSSINPVKSLNLYGLECSQLEVEDRCIVLTAFVEKSTNTPSQNERRLSPILESNQSGSQISIASSSETSSRRVSYFGDSNFEMDDHVLI